MRSGQWCGSSVDFRRQWAASRACRRISARVPTPGWARVVRRAQARASWRTAPGRWTSGSLGSNGGIGSKLRPSKIRRFTPNRCRSRSCSRADGRGLLQFTRSPDRRAAAGLRGGEAHDLVLDRTFILVFVILLALASRSRSPHLRSSLVAALP